MPKRAAATQQHTVQEAAANVATSDQQPDTPYPDTVYASEATRSEQAITAAAAQGSGRTEIGFIELDDTSTYINALWYGREGTSKTTSIATAANLGQMLLVNAEAGIKRKPLSDLGINTGNIKVWPRPGQKITFDGLEELYWQIKAELDDQPGLWAAVGFDSLTEITQLLLEDIVAGEVQKATAKGMTRDRFMIGRDDYRVMSGQVRTLIRRFRDLPCHFVATCLERKDTDEDTQKVMYGPAITPALQSDVLGFMDLVLYCKSEEIGDVEEFRAATRAGARHRAKDRYKATPRVLVTPTLARVHDYVTGKLTEDNDEEAQRSAERRRQWNEQAAAEQAKKAAEKPASTRRTRATAAKEQ